MKSNKTSFKKGNPSPKYWLGKIGNIHPNWKGDEVGYMALHSWINRRKGNPKICEYCGVDYKIKKLAWANIDHEYHRVLNDFISLCYSCHKKYDRENK